MILRRKEWERRLNDGCFVWGIGNAVVAQLDALVSEEPNPKVVFSRIRSPAQAIDSEAGRVFLWTAFRHRQQIYELPRSVLVTSRAITSSGAGKVRHYALFCQSNSELKSASTGFDLADVVNLTTGNPVGFSQVTAVVRYRGAYLGLVNDRHEYWVDAHADLVFPFCAPLENPVELTDPELQVLRQAAVSLDLEGWQLLVSKYRAEADRRLDFQARGGHPRLF